MQSLNPKILLLGEAPGYKGCKLSGIPFTSEYHILHEEFFKDGFAVFDRTNPNKEASACAIWEVLSGINKLPLMWNIYPFHPMTADGRNGKPARIVLRAYNVHRHYMASLPLHDSQQLIEDTGEYSDFELTVAPTYDLVMKLLSFGAMIEVMEPVTLRDTMRGWVSELHEMYKERER